MLFHSSHRPKQFAQQVKSQACKQAGHYSCIEMEMVHCGSFQSRLLDMFLRPWQNKEPEVRVSLLSCVSQSRWESLPSAAAAAPLLRTCGPRGYELAHCQHGSLMLTLSSPAHTNGTENKRALGWEEPRLLCWQLKYSLYKWSILQLSTALLRWRAVSLVLRSDGSLWAWLQPSLAVISFRDLSAPNIHRFIPCCVSCQGHIWDLTIWLSM